jgi:hypothetical protein
MVSSQYTRGLSRESMKCHYVTRFVCALLWELLGLLGSFVCGGGAPQFTSFDAILWAPLLLLENVFLFSVRQCSKLYRNLVYVFFRESFRWQKKWGGCRLHVFRIEAIRSSFACGHEDDLKKKLSEYILVFAISTTEFRRAVINVFCVMHVCELEQSVSRHL